jgi:hypothetical protein
MASGSPATAHLFIVNSPGAAAWRALLSTHPSMKDRIARLVQMPTPGSPSPAGPERRRPGSALGPPARAGGC